MRRQTGFFCKYHYLCETNGLGNENEISAAFAGSGQELYRHQFYLKKALFIIVMLLSSAAVSFAQYAAKPTEEVTLEKQFKIAKNTSTAGIVVASTGAAAWLCGSVMCTVAENRYINSHNTSGSVEEIYDLKQEAKKQSNYKTGQVVEISGYVMVLAGAGTIWIGQSKIKKLNNASNATLSYGVNGAGVALALKF